MNVRGLPCWLVAIALPLALLLGGCANDPTPHLFTVLDVAPREAEVGDRLEIVGTGFPEGETARVTFHGKLHRPGVPAKEADVEVDAPGSSAGKIDFSLTEGLAAAFCGSGDDATHTTFEGDVVVTFRAREAGGMPAVGTARKITLDFRPPSVRRAIAQHREDDATRALAFLGITPAGDSPTAGGLAVAAVTPGGPADKAGVLAGDVVTRFDGVSVRSRTDLVPSGGARTAELVLARGAGGDSQIRTLDVAGFRPTASSDLLASVLSLAIALGVLLLFMAPTAGIITWVERRVAARMQSRIGPNRAGPHGFFVWMADGIKSIMKEDLVPAEADATLFRVAPYLVFLGVSATFCVMPFGVHLIAADLDIGILYVVSVTSLVTIGLMVGGWASNNKWSLLGGVRSAAQIVSYEIPGAVAIACIVMMTGSLRVQEIVRAQGGSPWEWYLFRTPVTFVLFFVWLTTALAEGNRAPFDLPEAESELVAGYSTEYSGMRYLFFFFAEWANVFVMSGIASALFLGGWQIPGIDPMRQEASFGLQILGALLFQLKSWVMIFLVIWIRWTLPRVRVDQMMALCWKWLVPVSFVLFVLTAVWVMLSPSKAVETTSGLVVFAASCVFFVQFVRRVRMNLRTTNAQVHLNPFL